MDAKHWHVYMIFPALISKGKHPPFKDTTDIEHRFVVEMSPVRLIVSVLEKFKLLLQVTIRPSD